MSARRQNLICPRSAKHRDRFRTVRLSHCCATPHRTALHRRCCVLEGSVLGPNSSAHVRFSLRGRVIDCRHDCCRFCRRLFIQTEPTPNPESLKFLPGKPVLESGAREFRSFREAQASPLAKKLLQTDGDATVFLSTDFVTISKTPDADWLTLKPQIFEVHSLPEQQCALLSSQQARP